MYNITGKVPRYVRPPYGDMDVRVNTIFKAMDLVSVIWNAETLDTDLNDPATKTADDVLSIVNGFLAQSFPNGVISLEHDRFQKTAALAPTISQKVMAAYQTVKMSECVSSQNRGPLYATSGKLYQLVTGYPDEASNPGFL